MRIDLRLELLQIGVAGADFLQVYVLDQSFDLLGHVVEADKQKVELVARTQHVDGAVIAALDPTDAPHQLADRHLDVDVQKIGGDRAADQEKEDGTVEQIAVRRNRTDDILNRHVIDEVEI
ncbi:hypothetical protein D3C71_1763470 [compost metagenome]